MKAGVVELNAKQRKEVYAFLQYIAKQAEALGDRLDPKRTGNPIDEVGKVAQKVAFDLDLGHLL